MSGGHGDGSGGTARGVCGNSGAHYGRNVGTEVSDKGASLDLVCAGAALNDDRCNVGLQDRISAEAISISRVAVAIRDSIYDTCLCT